MKPEPDPNLKKSGPSHHYRGGFVKLLILTQEVTTQSATKIITLMIIYLAIPKAGARLELLFRKLASEAGLLNNQG